MEQSTKRILNSLSETSMLTSSVIADTPNPVSGRWLPRPIRSSPHTGVFSLIVAMAVGDMIETAMVGRDGTSLCNGESYRSPAKLRS